MADQFCPHCGTEVDADARFCPTCGRTLLAETEAPEEPAEAEALQPARPPDAADEPSAIPAAPAWPPPEPRRDEVPADEPEEEPPAAEAPEPAAAPPPPAAPPSAGRQPTGGNELPFTLPVMLSGWLIGAGSGFGALALLPRLASLLNVLIFVALLWVAATVFLADRMPRFPQERLAVLVVVMIGTGAALDRAGFRVNVNSIFLIAMLVAAAGVLLLELGRDRPVQTGGRS